MRKMFKFINTGFLYIFLFIANLFALPDSVCVYMNGQKIDTAFISNGGWMPYAVDISSNKRDSVSSIAIEIIHFGSDTAAFQLDSVMVKGNAGILLLDDFQEYNAGPVSTYLTSANNRFWFVSGAVTGTKSKFSIEESSGEKHLLSEYSNSSVDNAGIVMILIFGTTGDTVYQNWSGYSTLSFKYKLTAREVVSGSTNFPCGEDVELAFIPVILIKARLFFRRNRWKRKQKKKNTA